MSAVSSRTALPAHAAPRRRTAAAAQTPDSASVVSSASTGSRSDDEPNPAAAAEAVANGDRDPHDFLWMYTEEPHRSRRMAILKAHPEVSEVEEHCSLRGLG